ncbi:MAG: type II toxin-antitoxin system VapC family toxin [Polaromonas sp.]
MIALDTNQLARLLLKDDTAQHKKVKALFETRQIFTAPVTVMLELVWVLESRDISAAEIAAGLNALLNLPNFKPERVDALRQALRSYTSGTGFADALHLALSEGQEKFITFDKAFVKQSRKLELKPEVMLA